KTVSWHTAATSRCEEGIPRQFTTTSRVAIIANQWRSLSADVAALEDRGHCVQFAPSALEVHGQAAAWVWDQEVFDFIGVHLHLAEQASLRVYVRAWELKRAGLDWRHAVLSRCLTGVALQVAKLKSNPTYTSEEQRARAFVAAGLGCRATYFNHAKRFKSLERPSQIPLAHSTPPAEVAPNEDYLDALRRRFGQLGNG